MSDSGIKRRGTAGRLFWLAAAAVLLLTPVPVRAASAQVCDDAGLFTEEETALLAKDVDALEELTGWDAMVITADDPAIDSAQEYAERRFHEMASKDDGVVYLLDMNNRELYIATAGEAYLYLVDVRLNEALDDAWPYAHEGDYAQAMRAMIADTASFYEAGKPDGLTVYDEDAGVYSYYEENPPRLVTFGELILAVAAGAAACLATVLIVVGKYRLKFGGYRYNFRENASLQLTRQNDRLVNRFVTRRQIPKNPPPQGGGGGNTTIHTGAGGRSFGGGGRKF